MGLQLPYEIQCSCGLRFKANLWEYIFVEHDPELKEMILSGEFNLLTCPSCQERLSGDIGFLYRDETNGLWVWVRSPKDDNNDMPESIEEKIEGYFLDNQNTYEKHTVSGRGGLLELLLKEDQELKETEPEALKRNPAIKAMKNEEEGVLVLTGDRLKNIPLPLATPSCMATDQPWETERKKAWFDYYFEGLNLHNPYSSFLDKNMVLEWKNLLAGKNIAESRNEYEAFAGLWADFRLEDEDCQHVCGDFFRKVGEIDVTREIVSLPADFS